MGILIVGTIGVVFVLAFFMLAICVSSTKRENDSNMNFEEQFGLIEPKN